MAEVPKSNPINLPGPVQTPAPAPAPAPVTTPAAEPDALAQADASTVTTRPLTGASASGMVATGFLSPKGYEPAPWAARGTSAVDITTMKRAESLVKSVEVFKTGKEELQRERYERKVVEERSLARHEAVKAEGIRQETAVSGLQLRMRAAVSRGDKQEIAHLIRIMAQERVKQWVADLQHKAAKERQADAARQEATQKGSLQREQEKLRIESGGARRSHEGSLSDAAALAAAVAATRGLVKAAMARSDPEALRQLLAALSADGLGALLSLAAQEGDLDLESEIFRHLPTERLLALVQAAIGQGDLSRIRQILAALSPAQVLALLKAGAAAPELFRALGGQLLPERLIAVVNEALRSGDVPLARLILGYLPASQTLELVKIAVATRDLALVGHLLADAAPGRLAALLRAALASGNDAVARRILGSLPPDRLAALVASGLGREALSHMGFGATQALGSWLAARLPSGPLGGLLAIPAARLLSLVAWATRIGLLLRGNPEAPGGMALRTLRAGPGARESALTGSLETGSPGARWTTKLLGPDGRYSRREAGGARRERLAGEAAAALSRARARLGGMARDLDHLSRELAGRRLSKGNRELLAGILAALEEDPELAGPWSLTIRRFLGRRDALGAGEARALAAALGDARRAFGARLERLAALAAALDTRRGEAIPEDLLAELETVVEGPERARGRALRSDAPGDRALAGEIADSTLAGHLEELRAAGDRLAEQAQAYRADLAPQRPGSEEEDPERRERGEDEGRQDGEDSRRGDRDQDQDQEEDRDRWQPGGEEAGADPDEEQERKGSARARLAAVLEALHRMRQIALRRGRIVGPALGRLSAVAQRFSGSPGDGTRPWNRGDSEAGAHNTLRNIASQSEGDFSAPVPGALHGEGE